MSQRWDSHFLKLAIEHARMSKDPSTKVGAVLVGPNKEIRGAGFNGFPFGVADTMPRLMDRDWKLATIVHAEMNVIMACARVGIATNGCSLYVMGCDAIGNPAWSGPPCRRCSAHVIQAGIAEVVHADAYGVPERWADDVTWARALLDEGGVAIREARLAW